MGKSSAAIAFIATIYVLVAAVATHIVSTQYDFFRDYISDYAIGPWGWIWQSAFIASFIAPCALALALAGELPKAALSRVGLVLLVVVGFANLLDFFFPTDILPPGAPPATTIGRIHLAAALIGWLSFVVGGPLLSRRIAHAGLWRWQGRLLLVLAWLATPLLLILIAVVASRVPFGGLAEKLYILNRSAWALLLAGLLIWRPAGQKITSYRR